MNSLDIQVASQSKQLPTLAQFQYWVDAVLNRQAEETEILIRLIDKEEMRQLNQQYRDQKGITNILSFPFQPPEYIENSLLGDLLVCAPVIEQESVQQNKLLTDHWAHIIIHGVLHLLGYDHLNDIEAEKMESLEIEILKTIKIKNPYQKNKK